MTKEPTENPNILNSPAFRGMVPAGLGNASATRCAFSNWLLGRCGHGLRSLAAITTTLMFVWLGSQSPCHAQKREVVIQPVLVGDEIRFFRKLSVSLGEHEGSFTILIAVIRGKGEVPAQTDLDGQIMQQAALTKDALIRKINAYVQLDDSQEAKLRNAAKADAARLARLFRAWAAETKLDTDPNARQLRANVGDTATLNGQLTDIIYGEDGLFAKVFDATISKAQRDALREHYLRWFVELHQRLDDEQRTALYEMLQVKADSVSLALTRENYCRAVASRLPKQELEELVGNASSNEIRSAALIRSKQPAERVPPP